MIDEVGVHAFLFLCPQMSRPKRYVCAIFSLSKHELLYAFDISTVCSKLQSSRPMLSRSLLTFQIDANIEQAILFLGFSQRVAS